MDRRLFLKTALAYGLHFAFPSLAMTGQSLRVVLDDAGESRTDTRHIKQLQHAEVPLTISAIAYSAKEKRVLEQIISYPQADIFLHQPMQALGERQYYTAEMNPITMDTPIDQYPRIIARNLEQVNSHGKNAIGMNNHTGSRVTADYERCKAIAKACKALNLILLDSVTSKHSMLFQAGINTGVRAFKRDYWLDDNPQKLFTVKDGSILIGHISKEKTIAGIINYYSRNPESLQHLTN